MTTLAIIDDVLSMREEERIIQTFTENFDLHGSAKEWSLGCVNSPSTARGTQEAGFTQPKDHSFAQLYTDMSKKSQDTLRGPVL